MGTLAKAALKSRGNTAYAFMILIGWGATMLVAANTALGHAMGHALVDGQLYFTGTVVMLAIAGGSRLLRPRLPQRGESHGGAR